jgi:hypothetical protein
VNFSLYLFRLLFSQFTNKQKKTAETRQTDVTASPPFALPLVVGRCSAAAATTADDEVVGACREPDRDRFRTALNTIFIQKD